MFLQKTLQNIKYRKFSFLQECFFLANINKRFSKCSASMNRWKKTMHSSRSPVETDTYFIENITHLRDSFENNAVFRNLQPCYSGVYCILFGVSVAVYTMRFVWLLEELKKGNTTVCI